MTYNSELQSNNADLQAILDTVNALPDGAAAKLQEKTVTPSATSQAVTADDGYDGLSKVTVNGDSNLTADNIAEYVTVFGVEGTLPKYESFTVWNETDVNLFFRDSCIIAGESQEYPYRYTDYPSNIYTFLYDSTFIGSEFDLLVLVDGDAEVVYPMSSQTGYGHTVCVFYDARNFVRPGGTLRIIPV